MNTKRLIILILSMIITAVFVCTGVVAWRLKEAAKNPVSVFFGDEIIVPDATKSSDQPRIPDVDLVLKERSYKKKDNILSIAILGRDATPPEEQRVDGGNTDIMIVVAIDLITGDVKAISIPRDTIAHIYHSKHASPEIDLEYFHKLNGAYGAGGPMNTDEVQLSNSVRCIEEHLNTFGTFDVSIDKYIEISLVGLRELTDIVGGVEITLDNGIPGVGSSGQTVKLNGKTAMTFVRDRYNFGGDLGRVSNAQKYIRSLAKKIQTMGITEIGTQIATTFIKENLMRTNLSPEEIAALAGLLSNIKIDGVPITTIPVKEENDIAGFKDYLKTYDFDYQAFYGAAKWETLDILPDNRYSFGFFTDYDALETIMLDTYYDEIVQ